MKQLLKQFKDLCLRSDIRTAKKLMKKRIYEYLDLRPDMDSILLNPATLEYKIARWDQGYIDFSAWEKRGFTIYI